MNDIFDFIAVKKIEKESLLKDLSAFLSLKEGRKQNLFISILPPIDDLYLIEFADFLPVPRYRDVNAIDYLEPVIRTFSKVFFFYKNDQVLQSKYKKYFNGKIESDQKGEKALEKALKFDLILEFNDLQAHVNKIWDNDYCENDLKPDVYQLIDNNVVLKTPVKIDYMSFYGNNKD